MMDKTIVIAGAGISGLTLGCKLIKKGHKVLIVEKEDKIGGLARTFRYKDFSFDIGPHRFFTRNPKVLKFIKDLDSLRYKTIPRKAAVFLRNKHYKWPLKPDVFFRLPFELTVKAAFDLFFSNRKFPVDINNFEQYIKKVYGPTLYNNFFKDYNEKFFCLPNSQIHSDWVKESIEKAVIDKKISLKHLEDLLRLTLKLNRGELKFLYPEKGIGSFCYKLCEDFKYHGGEVLTGGDIKGISTFNNDIKYVFVDNRKIFVDKLIWTGDLGDICSLLKINNFSLNYLHLMLFNIELNHPVKIRNQWVYFGSKGLCFNRITFPSLFSKRLVPKNKDSLCVEVTFNNIDNSNEDIETEHIKGKVLKDLKKINYIDSYNQIDDVHTEIIHNAYPIYSLNYKRKLNDIFDKLSEFSNLYLNGRTACFWYNNMDECIDEAIRLSETIDK